MKRNTDGPPKSADHFIDYEEDLVFLWYRLHSCKVVFWWNDHSACVLERFYNHRSNDILVFTENEPF